MRPEELRSLISQGESDTLELKASVPHPELIARYLASFANTKGGHIVFGVQEPIETVGVDVARVQRALDFALTKVDPRPDVALETVVLDGHPVAVVSIQRSVALVSAYGGYYRRVGDSMQPLNAEEIRAHALSASTIEKALSDLSALAAKQTQTIDNLREEFASANSLPKKLGIAAVGAVLGALAKYLVDVFLL